MAAADWTICNDSLDQASLDRGPTSGLARPSGGGSFLYGFNSLASVNGAAGLFFNGGGFAPTTKGGSIRGAVQRGISGGQKNFSPFLFIGLQGPSVNDKGYLLGLSDEEPSRIVLVKGSLTGGIPSTTPGNLGVLRRSNATIPGGTWVHLRLDMLVNPSGDVILTAWQSDLAANPVTAPVWTRIPGFADSVNAIYDFNDDALAINSGSAALTSGRMGYGFAAKDVTRRGFFDHLECLRQN